MKNLTSEIVGYGLVTRKHRVLTQSVCVAVCVRNSQRRTQTHPKSLKKTAFEAKGPLYTTGKVIQRLFIIDLYT